MDLAKYSSNLLREAQSLPEKNRLPFIQRELKKITTPYLRKSIETFIQLGIELGTNSADREEIIVLIHGINTQGIWCNLVQNYLEENGFNKVIPVKYGYFDPIRFWFPFGTRKKPIKHIVREIRDIQTNNKNYDIVIIAHSFGTYIISEILKKDFDISIKRLLLCGSIIDENFRWDALPKFPNIVLNECGTQDIWPLAAKALSWGYGISGTFGFNSSRVINRHHNVGHDGFFNKEFISTYWLPFLSYGEIEKSKWDYQRPTPSFFKSSFPSWPWKTLIFLLIASPLYFLFQ